MAPWPRLQRGTASSAGEPFGELAGGGFGFGAVRGGERRSCKPAQYQDRDASQNLLLSDQTTGLCVGFVSGLCEDLKPRHVAHGLQARLGKRTPTVLNLRIIPASWTSLVAKGMISMAMGLHHLQLTYRR